MEITNKSRLGINSGFSYLFFVSMLIAVLALLLLAIPVNAAQEEFNSNLNNSQTEPECTPPSDWGQTTRLKVPDKPSKQWSFSVDEPEMIVNLEFFYYQDYSKAGCPYDCSTGECQTDETGKGQSPFGEFSVVDGMEGANRGSKQLSGRLTQGTYQVTFTANGNPGSINLGLKIQQEAVPTPTPTNTPVPSVITPTSTSTPETPEPTIRTPEPEDTATPTTKPKRTPPATLPPPTPFPGSPPPQALIPQTGFELGQTASAMLLVLVTLGVGIIGLGFTFYGINKRLKEK
jgi:hypothetical protein